MTGNAAIYSSHPPLDASFFRGHPATQNVHVTFSPEGVPSRYSLEISGTCISLNVMPHPEVHAHLNGFRAYISHLPPSEHTQPLLTRLKDVRTVIGVIVEPDYDEQEQAAELVWAIAEALEALVFAADSVFSCSGEPLVGPATGAEA